MIFSWCSTRPLGRSVAIVVGVTMVELLVVTPLNGGIGFQGSFVDFAVGLFRGAGLVVGAR
jgi:hypothetical protein